MAYHVECGELEPESAAKGPKFQPHLVKVTSPSELATPRYKNKLKHLKTENLVDFVGVRFFFGGQI